MRHLVRLADEIESLPRHLGQHSGGMVIAAGRLDEVVPLEPASMPGRVVIQWDKEDCADLGIIKVDLLGLGMMAVLEEAIPLVRRHEGVELDLAQLPPDDPEVYGALQKADTIGVFQIESRAQMATLPRMKPQRFYDLVVEVAIIRPGPIVGQMVHPYLNRRAGREPVRYPHPLLEPILRRTLGVPLFQEQLLRIAMVAASFTPGEAEELRRAMGFKRSVERMHAIEQRLRDGMAKNGITGKTAEEIVHAITSFALYGFPECVDGETRVLDAQSGRRIKIEDVALGPRAARGHPRLRCGLEASAASRAEGTGERSQKSLPRQNCPRAGDHGDRGAPFPDYRGMAESRKTAGRRSRCNRQADSESRTEAMGTSSTHRVGGSHRRRETCVTRRRFTSTRLRNHIEMNSFEPSSDSTIRAPQ